MNSTVTINLKIRGNQKMHDDAILISTNFVLLCVAALLLLCRYHIHFSFFSTTTNTTSPHSLISQKTKTSTKPNKKKRERERDIERSGKKREKNNNTTQKKLRQPSNKSTPAFIKTCNKSGNSCFFPLSLFSSLFFFRHT